MRFVLNLSRKLFNLDEVKTVFKYFEKYGRLQEFAVYRDFFTREREGVIFITYDERTVKSPPKENETHTIQLRTPIPDKERSIVPTDKKNLEFQVSVRIVKDPVPLRTSIERRSMSLQRTSPLAQMNINRNLLGGFEGFHGELDRLWTKIAEETNENKARQFARDSLQSTKGVLERRKGGRTRETLSERLGNNNQHLLSQEQRIVDAMLGNAAENGDESIYNDDVERGGGETSALSEAGIGEYAQQLSTKEQKIGDATLDNVESGNRDQSIHKEDVEKPQKGLVENSSAHEERKIVDAMLNNAESTSGDVSVNKDDGEKPQKEAIEDSIVPSGHDASTSTNMDRSVVTETPPETPIPENMVKAEEANADATASTESQEQGKINSNLEESKTTAEAPKESAGQVV